MLSRVEDAAAKKLGYENAEARMVDEVNKNDDAFWKLKTLQARVEPKELTVAAENSAEALLAALEAQQRGEIIVFEDDKPQLPTPKIPIEDAQFEEVENPGVYREIKGIAVTI